MEKFKGYIGVFVALLFCSLLIPVQGAWQSSANYRMTPLDTTLISVVTLKFSEKGQLLEKVAHFLRDCDDEKKATTFQQSPSLGIHSPTPCIFLFEFVGHEAVKDSLQYAYDQEIANAYWDQYIKYIEKRLKVGRDRSTEILLPEIKSLSKPLGYAIVKNAEHLRSQLMIYIYLVNFIALINILLLFTFRRKIGGAILLPFTFLFKAGTSTAKKIHDEI